MHPYTNEPEPDRDTLQSALLASARLWLGAALLNSDACECVASVLLDDAAAAIELHSAGDWLLASASRLPSAMTTVRLLRLLSTSQTLDDVH
jgi:hypothetical protein